MLPGKDTRGFRGKLEPSAKQEKSAQNCAGRDTGVGQTGEAEKGQVVPTRDVTTWGKKPGGSWPEKNKEDSCVGKRWEQETRVKPISIILVTREGPHFTNLYAEGAVLKEVDFTSQSRGHDTFPVFLSVQKGLGDEFDSLRYDRRD